MLTKRKNNSHWDIVTLPNNLKYEATPRKQVQLHKRRLAHLVSPPPLLTIFFSFYVLTYILQCDYRKLLFSYQLHVYTAKSQYQLHKADYIKGSGILSIHNSHF